MKSNLISKRDTAMLLKTVSAVWNMEMPRIKNLKIHQITNDAQLVTGSGLRILKIGQEYLPFLSETKLLERFPHVVVDVGAIRFMCNGANVMRPGIKAHSEFESNDIVCVIEESRRKFLAVGKAVISSAELDTMEKGEVLKNLHYISDRFWDIAKTVRD